MKESNLLSEPSFQSFAQDPKVSTSSSPSQNYPQTFQLINVMPKSDYKTQFFFSNLTFIRDSIKNQIQCSQRINDFRQYNFDGIGHNQLYGQLDSTHKLQSKKGNQRINHQQQLRKEIKKISANIMSIQLIKVDEPYGTNIFVSYSLKFEKWIISNGVIGANYSCQEDIQQHSSSKLKQILYLWNNLLKNVHNIQLFKQRFAQYTFCGKINIDLTIQWYSLIKTKRIDSPCEDPFDSKQIVQHLGFKFTKIKTISVVMNEDQIVRALQSNVNSIRSSFSEGKNNTLGRCKIIFVSSYNKKVLGGFNISTLQDILFHYMSQLSKLQITLEEKMNIFQLQCRQLDKNRNLPFPINHYTHIFKNTLETIQKCSISAQYRSSSWNQLLKFVLYLTSKKIDISVHGKLIFNKAGFKQEINKCSLEQFGPSNCSIITIYSTILPKCQFKQKVIQHLRTRYTQMCLHFQTIESSGDNEINITQVIQKVIPQSKKLNFGHFFLYNTPSLAQRKCLIRQLQTQNKQCFFKLALVIQKIQCQNIIGANSYPFSIQMMARVYHQVYNNHMIAQKLQEKTQQLKKISQYILKYKNQELDKQAIQICPQIVRQTPEIKSIIQLIVKSEDQQNIYNECYYKLMILLGKRVQSQKCDFNAIADYIIRRTYYGVKTISQNI